MIVQRVDPGILSRNETPDFELVARVQGEITLIGAASVVCDRCETFGHIFGRLPARSWGVLGLPKI